MMPPSLLSAAQRLNPQQPISRSPATNQSAQMPSASGDRLSAQNPQLAAFANNPDFAATLQQALNAMSAVDPSLLTLNSQLLGIGGQNMPVGQPGLPLMAADGLLSRWNEAQKVII
jgi:hypothetical protein